MLLVCQGVTSPYDLRIRPVDLEVLQLGYRLSKAWAANGGCGKRQFIDLENGWHLEEQLQYPPMR